MAQSFLDVEPWGLLNGKSQHKTTYSTAFLQMRFLLVYNAATIIRKTLAEAVGMLTVSWICAYPGWQLKISYAFVKGSHGPGEPAWTPEGFCVFSDPQLYLKKIVKSRTRSLVTFFLSGRRMLAPCKRHFSSANIPNFLLH